MDHASHTRGFSREVIDTVDQQPSLSPACLYSNFMAVQTVNFKGLNKMKELFLRFCGVYFKTDYIHGLRVKKNAEFKISKLQYLHFS